MEGRGSLWTPPFARRRSHQGRRNTPVDERGIVDIDRTILIVKDRIPERKLWTPGEVLNDHHFYYPNENYDSELEMKFRELPPNKGRLPFGFHMRLHQFMIPPIKPHEKVMESYCESWDIASNLLGAAREVKRHSRKEDKMVRYALKRLEEGNINEEIVEDILTRHFAKTKGSEEWLKRKIASVASMPEEFTGIPVNELSDDVSADVVLILGRSVLNGSRNLVERVQTLELQLAAA